MSIFEFKIGQIVEVVNTGATYSQFCGMAKKLGLDIAPEISEHSFRLSVPIRKLRELSKGHKWKHRDTPNKGDICTIVSISDSYYPNGGHIGIERMSDGQQFVIGAKGIKLVRQLFLSEELFEI